MRKQQKKIGKAGVKPSAQLPPPPNGIIPARKTHRRVDTAESESSVGAAGQGSSVLRPPPIAMSPVRRGRPSAPLAMASLPEGQLASVKDDQTREDLCLDEKGEDISLSSDQHDTGEEEALSAALVKLFECSQEDQAHFLEDSSAFIQQQHLTPELGRKLEAEFRRIRGIPSPEENRLVVEFYELMNVVKRKMSASSQALIRITETFIHTMNQDLKKSELTVLRKNTLCKFYAKGHSEYWKLDKEKFRILKKLKRAKKDSERYWALEAERRELETQMHSYLSRHRSQAKNNAEFRITPYELLEKDFFDNGICILRLRPPPKNASQREQMLHQQSNAIFQFGLNAYRRGECPHELNIFAKLKVIASRWELLTNFYVLVCKERSQIAQVLEVLLVQCKTLESYYKGNEGEILEQEVYLQALVAIVKQYKVLHEHNETLKFIIDKVKGSSSDDPDKEFYDEIAQDVLDDPQLELTKEKLEQMRSEYLNRSKQQLTLSSLSRSQSALEGLFRRNRLKGRKSRKQSISSNGSPERSQRSMSVALKGKGNNPWGFLTPQRHVRQRSRSFAQSPSVLSVDR